MTNNPTVDGVSRLVPIDLLERVSVLGLSVTKDQSAAIVELRALLDADHTGDPDAMVTLREHCKQCAEVVKTWPEWKQNCLGGFPSGGRLDPVTDSTFIRGWEVGSKILRLRKEAIKYIQTGQSESDGNGNKLEPLYRENHAPEITALRSTFAQLQARIAELESGLGGMLFAFDDGVGRYWSEEILDYARKLTPAVEFDATAPPAPVSVVPDGWRLVPVEPDRNMRLASNRYKRDTKLTSGPGFYRAMLKAAPACLDATAALNGVKK